MTAYEQLCDSLRHSPKQWLVTGAAGFIGSHLTQQLLSLGQRVRALDNFATGHRRNLDDVRRMVGEEAWTRFEFVEGSITDADTCSTTCQGVDFILHQAALGSVPRSIATPLNTHAANATGFVHMLHAAVQAGVKRMVYASSSSVYGDSPDLPKKESVIGRPLSPYAASKRVDEIYADAFANCYPISLAGLRYFNVFGARQDPAGPYAAVIPKWVALLLRTESPEIYGDGETSRDFTYIANVVQANLLAACTPMPDRHSTVYNVAVHDRTSLNTLFSALTHILGESRPDIAALRPTYKDFRAGDVRHSLADISKAVSELGYCPTHDLATGLREALNWYACELPAGLPQLA